MTVPEDLSLYGTGPEYSAHCACSEPSCDGDAFVEYDTTDLQEGPLGLGLKCQNGHVTWVQAFYESHSHLRLADTPSAVGSKHPMQRITEDRRFVENKIVSWLLESHPFADWNQISALPFDAEDYDQLMQLTGYPVDSYIGREKALKSQEAQRTLGRMEAK